MLRETRRVLADLGFAVPADAILGELTIGQQQLVATARAAVRGARFLIFDEPTAYLTRQEAAQLFALIRRLKAEGVTLVYISHRLEEVFELADRVSVLRDGRLVSTRRVAETDEAVLIRDMINRSIEQIYHKDDFAPGETLVEVSGYGGRGFDGCLARRARGRDRRAVRADRRRTQRVRADAVRALPAQRGLGALARQADSHPPRGGGDRGAAWRWCRRAGGTRGSASISASASTSTSPSTERLTRGLLIDRRAESTQADRQIRDLRIVAAGRGAEAATLSGGNQQKIVVGKWLAHGARLFIFDEPTVGVDVGTKAQIYRVFADLLREGAGIILISSYLPEVYELADRLHVFRRGRLVARYGHKDASMEEILAQAIGA